MNDSSTMAAVRSEAPARPAVLRDAWLDVAILTLLALALRLWMFNGPIGSDDGTYFERALDVATGRWSVADYNGALRYGFNLPAGAMLYLFGTSVFVANLWPLACSLAEVALAYAVARDMFGRRAALGAALILATLPLHLGVATRIHADPVVSLFVTLGYALLWFAGRRSRRALYFAAGVAFGAVFWAKELAAVVYVALIPLALLEWRRWREWLLVALGAALMLALHLALMQAIAHDPLHLFKVVLGAVKRNFVDAGKGEDAPWFYLRYLFVDPRHTWLLGWLAAAGIVAAWRARDKRGGIGPAMRFCLWWLCGLLAVLSVLPVSLAPLRFPMKQSNYLTLFVAPLAVLAGSWLARLRPRIANPLLAIATAGGVALGLLQQADYQTFSANSRALVAFAAQRPDAFIVGSVNNRNIVEFYARLQGDAGMAARVVAFRDVVVDGNAPDGRRFAFAVVDAQTDAWMAGRGTPTGALPCWTPFTRLAPPAEHGAGQAFALWLQRALGGLPVPGAARVASAFGQLAEPKPAVVYAVPDGDLLCRAGPGRP